eukprot:3159088-Pleurochrysis_carterae.AAC.2
MPAFEWRAPIRGRCPTSASNRAVLRHRQGEEFWKQKARKSHVLRQNELCVGPSRRAAKTDEEAREER